METEKGKAWKKRVTNESYRQGWERIFGNKSRTGGDETKYQVKGLWIDGKVLGTSEYTTKIQGNKLTLELTLPDTINYLTIQLTKEK